MSGPTAVILPALSPYDQVLALQEALVEARAKGEIGDVLLLLEHAEALTVGRERGSAANILHPGEVPVFEVTRGGNVTWHGPGQLVAYPIVLLEGARADLHAHIRGLEGAVIALLGELGISGRRDARNSGVWLEDPDGAVRKVCSIGVACRRWVTWHGLALNVANDPAVFERINPCGFTAAIMTTLQRHPYRAPGGREGLSPALTLAPRLGALLASNLGLAEASPPRLAPTLIPGPFLDWLRSAD